ncbi:MAG: NADP-dependent malic enzyme [Clostridia bacterium]|nr:NADP-dependent malic enzyme [Clostridia bacterium]
MDYMKKSLEMHEIWKGKLETCPKMKVEDKTGLSLAYTPGVAAPCVEIQKDRSRSYDLTGKGNTVAVISDGSAVLGLGNIGAEASMPVMEGKCVLFKAFAGLNAVPLCINSTDVDEIVDTIYRISPSFGGINLEDFSAPRCFEIERRLKELCDIPVFHDDQHGTAIVLLAALKNALRLKELPLENARIVVCGAGAAGMAVSKILLDSGATDLTLVRKEGIICRGDPTLDPYQAEIALLTNKRLLSGGLEKAIEGCDVFIGVSAPNIVSSDMIRSMNPKPIVFSMANPVPEIMPDVAKKAGAYIIGTGRSDYPNQINNVLAFPGVFKGALKARARAITEKMKLAAADAIASLVSCDELAPDFIIPPPFDPRVSEAVADAVCKIAQGGGD